MAASPPCLVLLLVLSFRITDGRIVSKTYTVNVLNKDNFAAQFPPVKTITGQPAKSRLFEQSIYNSKQRLCNTCFDLKNGDFCSDLGFKCRYATVYDEAKKIPLLSAKKYVRTSQTTWTSDLSRSEWDFSGALQDSSTYVTWPSIQGNGNCKRTFYDNPPKAITEGDIHKGHLLGAQLGSAPAPGTEPVKDAKSTFSTCPDCFNQVTSGRG